MITFLVLHLFLVQGIVHLDILLLEVPEDKEEEDATRHM
jgi:hypothetical protein